MRSVLMEPRGDWTRLADYPDGKQFDGVFWMKQLPSEQSHHMSDTNETSEILKSPRLPTKKSLHLYQGHSGHIYKILVLKKLAYVMKQRDFELIVIACENQEDVGPSSQGTFHQWQRERMNINSCGAFEAHLIFRVARRGLLVLSLTRDRETTGLSGATALIWGARLVLAKHLLIWFVPSAWIGDSESRERSPAQSSSPEKFKLLGLALTDERQTDSQGPSCLGGVHFFYEANFSGRLHPDMVSYRKHEFLKKLAGMGNLLKVLTREIENYPHFFLDFENAQPTEGEREVWNQISAVLQDSESILADLQAYKGAGPEIRDAIQNPNDIQLQEKAWNAVCPLVVRLKRFYEFSIRLEKALQSLLESLTCPPYTPTQHLEREQALAKEFAEILHFTLRFDELKMRNPAIQNDFSYYRRTISRNRINNMHLDIENEVNNEMANRMSLFYAEATPMLKTLSNATMHFVSENKTLPIENTTDCLSTMTSVCKVMLETPEYRSRFTSEETLMFCMRVMVGVIILYDHVHPVGAFCKTSKIDMKGCIKVLKEQAPDSVEGLLNALRFTTKHLNDESTSKQIRAMLQ
ncbi:hypothetical protein JEQ12_013662 [Ovis aries]|uniref:CYRIA/CYRIB Rac1 binding domain-containing protein n=16 Tax=Eutheria TaxID=9347 RepID=A0A836AJB8_SHEEP|nr:hypothetical protein JEQ12_013662 [Ovis aries]